ncbi:SusC/RagA family TonB-linked outer membrane protein [Sphingobacterium sp. Mn56C]|uniref:SusC/RagA family TonB-linked outer membrane protein n=1 Tax=Sphingobacterium sp. Mn56C TaxID=3395261 RepID=UPI003BBF2FFD
MKQKLLSFLLGGAILTSVAFAQEKKVSGQVLTSSGRAVADVTVQVSGTSIVTKTDANGNYSISVPEGKTLIFRSIGYSQHTIVVGKATTYLVTLDDANTDLDEVIVVGYGSAVASKNAVGSFSRVGAKDIEARPSANALDALQGKVPGLQVFTSSGEPSATPSVRLNGVGSINGGTSPLYVLDGIPVGSGSIVSLNPNDFESVTVLKDASATSIYGSRAANGVIYITTKKGARGDRATINARAQWGFSNLARSEAQKNMMNSAELQQYWLDSGFSTQEEIDKIRKDWPNDTYWTDYYFKQNVPTKQYDLDVSGGSDKTQYYISTSYFDQEGVMYRSGFDRLTLRSNVTTRLNDWVRLGLNLAGGVDKRQTNQYTSNSLQGGLAILALPWYTPYDKDGNEYYDRQIPGLARYSPKYLADKFPSQLTNQQFNPTAFIEVSPVKNLILKSQAGLDYFNSRTSTRRLPSYNSNLNNGTAREEWQQGVSRTITNTIEYKWNINDIHRLTALAGQEYTDYKQDGFFGEGAGVADDRLILLGNATNTFAVGQSKTEYAYNSYFGRLAYDYNSKVFFNATLRQDASSRFGRNNQKATFWSLGANWNIKQEAFLNNVEWLTDLRLKASIGTSGNSGGSESTWNFQHIPTVSAAQYNASAAWGLNVIGNPDLTWEKQLMSNIGFNATLFKKLNVDFEFFNRDTKSLLMNIPIPYTTGYSQILSNVGKLNNKGFNFEVSYNIFNSPDFYLTPSVTFGYVKQEIKELFQGRDYWIIPNTGVSYVVGQPISFFYPMLKGVNPENGNFDWYVPGPDNTKTNTDPNNVTQSFSSAALQQNTGIKRYAPINGGFGLNTGYKGIFLESYFTYSLGKYLINNDAFFFSNPGQFAGMNQTKAVNDFWKKPGDVTEFPRFGVARQFDDSLIENASFLRLKSFTLGYQLPKELLGRTKFFKGAKVYYTGRNLLTFTKFSGADPEIDSNLVTGANPNTKQSLFGFQLTF